MDRVLQPHLASLTTGQLILGSWSPWEEGADHNPTPKDLLRIICPRRFISWAGSFLSGL